MSITKNKITLKDIYRKDLVGRFNELDMLKNQFSRVINAFENNILPPYEILIHTSSICNLNCKWCIGSYVSSNKNIDKLLPNNLFKMENMKKVINDIISYKKIGYDYINNCSKEFRVENVTFSGITGEPLMSKETILYAIEELAKNNIRVGMFTNGLLIEKNMHENLLKMGYILISIDAGNSDTYNQLKCNGKDTGLYEKLLNNIKELCESKKIYNSNTDINVGYVINQYNFDQLFDLAKILKSFGVHYLRFKTDIASLMNMNDEQKKAAKQQINKIKTELCDEKFEVVEIHDVLKSREKERHFSKCYVHYLISNISADGKVYLCNYHPKTNGYNYGSAIEENYGEIWNNIMNCQIDKEIPYICPSVCDPFKNRSNRLLEQAYNIYNEYGIEELKREINEIEI